MLNPQEINQKKLGYYRDKKILQAIEEYKVLNTDQVHVLLFRNIEFEYGLRKAQERLLKLHKRGKLNRSRDGEKPFYYYSGDRPGMTKHLIGVNWIRIWLQTSLSSWEVLHSWSYEQDYKTLRCDGFAAIKNTATGKFHFLFIEMDRGTNAFDKGKKYNTLYNQNNYTSWWWVPLTDRFPPVQVVALTEGRKRLIHDEIEAHNLAGLEFRVKLLDEVKKEVMSKC